MSESQIGYCTNVHAGVTLDEVKQNLLDYSCEIKKLVSPLQPMGVGLWLSNDTCSELTASRQVAEFSSWLGEHGLLPFTCNGFPFNDFHQPVVKHQVYLPTWAEQARLDYTVRLARIHAQLLQPDHCFGTISTLPLGWRTATDPSFYDQCAKNLRECAARLAHLRDEMGVHTVLCIEPEPGCILDTCDDVTMFFRDYLLTGNDSTDQQLLNFVGVCHDVCHSAVMFENQQEALQAYRDAGIRVGKYQISSAIEADFRGQTESRKRALIEELSNFAEDRYLHQTTVANNGSTAFFEDLPLALQNNNGGDGIWRVHFHVPIYAAELGLLGTSQREIESCLSWCQSNQTTWPAHFEIETYAWNVLPAHLRSDSLVESVAKELSWFKTKF